MENIVLFIVLSGVIRVRLTGVCEGPGVAIAMFGLWACGREPGRGEDDIGS